MYSLYMCIHVMCILICIIYTHIFVIYEEIKLLSLHTYYTIYNIYFM